MYVESWIDLENMRSETEPRQGEKGGKRREGRRKEG
jgi:hypothetical protein